MWSSRQTERRTFSQKLILKAKKKEGHTLSMVTPFLSVTKSSRKFLTMVWNDQYNLEYA